MCGCRSRFSKTAINVRKSHAADRDLKSGLNELFREKMVLKMTIRIQRWMRRCLTRKRVRERKEAVRKIQPIVRGYFGRCVANKRHKAILTLQHWVRGWAYIQEAKHELCELKIERAKEHRALVHSFEVHLGAILWIQRFWRKRQARIRHTFESAVKIQTFWRLFHQLRRFKRTCSLVKWTQVCPHCVVASI